MSELTSSEQQQSQDSSEQITKFGYELIREVLLPELLGKDAPEILYWAGKRIARKYPLSSQDDIIDFFKNASWGELTLQKENKYELEFTLISPLLSPRSSSKAAHYYQLEAGFLAQQIQFQKEAITEAYEHPAKKENKVVFTVKWDKKDVL